MSRTKRTGNSKTAQRIVPLLAGAAVAVTSVVLMSGSPATASPKTVTVSFTGEGPSPASVTLNPGDTVIYENDVNPDDAPLLGWVAGTVQTVDITVAGAAQSPFTLHRGDTQALTYNSPVDVDYAAKYEPKLLSLVQGQAVTKTGTVIVQDRSGGSPPVVTPQPDTGASSASSPTQSGGTPGVGSVPGGQAAGNGGQPAHQGGPIPPRVNYTTHPGDAAAGQVPAAGATSGPSASAAPGGAAAATPGSDGSSDLPQVGGAQRGQDQAKAVTQASSDRSLTSLGLPAIMAVVLLSMVSAGLVRTIMVRSATVA